MKPVKDSIAARQAQILLEVIGRVGAAVGAGIPADQFLDRYYRAHREYGSRDRRLISAAVFAWFRWRGWTATMPDSGCALVAAWLLDGAALTPAIARLAEISGLKDVDPRPLQEPTLALKSAGYVRLFGVPAPDPAGVAPSWALETICCPAGDMADEHRMKWLSSLQTRPPTWLRAKRGTAPNAVAMLTGHDAALHATIPDAIRLSPGISSGQLAGLKGMVEIQDLASQVVGLVCNPSPGSRWWDVCAGSGGKALHLADLMREQGEIVATDVRPASVREALRRIGQAGLKRIIKPALWKGYVGAIPEGMFDGVLVDAPCSGLGTWHRNPDARWRIGSAAVAASAELQRNLLDLAARRVKDGGRMIYSVCTLTVAETVEVVEAFLRGHSGWHYDPFEDPFAKGNPVPGSLWIWPWIRTCNGMFVCRLRRG